MPTYRLGDDIDDYCVRCKRIMNHSVVSVMNAEPAKVRCRICHSDHDYRREVVPPTKAELKKQALFNEVLKTVDPSADPIVDPAIDPLEGTDRGSAGGARRARNGGSPRATPGAREAEKKASQEVSRAERPDALALRPPEQGPLIAAGKSVPLRFRAATDKERSAGRRSFSKPFRYVRLP